VPANVSLSPGCRSGVSADDRAPFCQQSPAGLRNVGADVLIVNGWNGIAMAANVPMATGAFVTASARVAVTVVRPNGRPDAITESPITVIVGVGEGKGNCACAAGGNAAVDPATANASVTACAARRRRTV
jgi:hypothetical protein